MVRCGDQDCKRIFCDRFFARDILARDVLESLNPVSSTRPVAMPRSTSSTPLSQSTSDHFKARPSLMRSPSETQSTAAEDGILTFNSADSYKRSVQAQAKRRMSPERLLHCQKHAPRLEKPVRKGWFRARNARWAPMRGKRHGSEGGVTN